MKEYFYYILFFITPIATNLQGTYASQEEYFWMQARYAILKRKKIINFLINTEVIQADSLKLMIQSVLKRENKSDKYDQNDLDQSSKDAEFFRINAYYINEKNEKDAAHIEPPTKLNINKPISERPENFLKHTKEDFQEGKADLQLYGGAYKKEERYGTFFVITFNEKEGGAELKKFHEVFSQKKVIRDCQKNSSNHSAKFGDKFFELILHKKQAGYTERIFVNQYTDPLYVIQALVKKQIKGQKIDDLIEEVNKTYDTSKFYLSYSENNEKKLMSIDINKFFKHYKMKELVDRDSDISMLTIYEEDILNDFKNGTQTLNQEAFIIHTEGSKLSIEENMEKKIEKSLENIKKHTTFDDFAGEFIEIRKNKEKKDRIYIHKNAGLLYLIRALGIKVEKGKRIYELKKETKKKYPALYLNTFIKNKKYNYASINMDQLFQENMTIGDLINSNKYKFCEHDRDTILSSFRKQRKKKGVNHIIISEKGHQCNHRQFIALYKKKKTNQSSSGTTQIGSKISKRENNDKTNQKKPIIQSNNTQTQGGDNINAEEVQEQITSTTEQQNDNTNKPNKTEKIQNQNEEKEVEQHNTKEKDLNDPSSCGSKELGTVIVGFTVITLIAMALYKIINSKKVVKRKVSFAQNK